MYDDIVEIDERVILCQDGSNLPNENSIERDISKTGESVELWKKIDEDVVRNQLIEVKKKGIKSLAVLLLHSYM